MSEGLSQDDFRKLLATPRRSDNDNTEFKAPAPKTPKSTGAIFAQPRSMRKNPFKKNFSKQDEQDQDQDQDEQEKSTYRDRAAERRKQDDSTISEDQLTTEELLQRTQIETGEELDAKQLYEQSKYLGGDVNHTHLVKGLDFALLKKVRTDLGKKQQRKADEHVQQDQEKESKEREDKQQSQDMDVDNDDDDDDDLDRVLEKFERGENIADDTTTATTSSDSFLQNKPKFHTLMAKNIYQLIQHQANPEEQPRVELFEPGRMAFVFELADEVGHYSDAFAIPTAMIRSKADIAAKLSKSGWSEESQAESSLVIGKISQVMNRVRRGTHVVECIKKPNTTTTMKILKQPVAMADDGFMGDIFADVGRDYELDESAVTATTDEAKGSYFKDLVDAGEEEEKEDQEMTEASHVAVNALLSQATGKADTEQKETDTTNKRKYNPIEMDADAADIDMFGLSSSALPTSFEEHTTAYQSDDDDNDTHQKEKSATQMMDQGTNRNKKAQLTRWDFDTEDEWQNYKDTIEIHPKSAFQYGVKLGDGRKRNRERKGMSDKQRLDRDYQQVKNIMSKKYGTSLDS